MGTLTDIRIRSWIKAGRPIAKADGGGLTFTLSTRGTTAWILRYRVGRRQREMTIGRYPEIGLAKAHELGASVRGSIQHGVDVGRTKQTTHAARASAQDFHALATSYMTVALPSMAPNTIRQRKRHIEKDLASQARQAGPVSTSTVAMSERSLLRKGWRGLGQERRELWC